MKEGIATSQRWANPDNLPGTEGTEIIAPAAARSASAHALEERCVRALEDDEQLVRASQGGDWDAFARLYARHRPRLVRRVIRVVGDRSLAEDVVQDTFLRAHAHIRRFDRSRELLPWLSTIALRIALDARRDRDRVRVGAETPEPPASATEDDTFRAVVDGQRRREVARALAALPDRQRRALVLHAVDGKRYTEIAEAVGTSVSSVESLIFRARSRLRAACAEGNLSALVLWPAALLRRTASRVADAGAAVGAGMISDAGHAAAGAALAVVLAVAGPVASGERAHVAGGARIRPPLVVTGASDTPDASTEAKTAPARVIAPHAAASPAPAPSPSPSVSASPSPAEPASEVEPDPTPGSQQASRGEERRESQGEPGSTPPAQPAEGPRRPQARASGSAEKNGGRPDGRGDGDTPADGRGDEAGRDGDPAGPGGDPGGRGGTTDARPDGSPAAPPLPAWPPRPAP